MESFAEDTFPELEDIDSTVEGIIEEQRDLLALESALSQIVCLENAAVELQELGISEDLIADQLSAPVITAIERVDTDIAEDVSVSLEADDKKSFWAKVKDTANRIWEAIKKTINSIIDWFISLFTKRKKASSSATIRSLKSVLSGNTKLDPKEIKLSNEWCINDKRTTAQDLVDTTSQVAKFNDVSDKFATALLKDALEVIANYKEKSLDGGSFDIQRIDKIERTEKNVGFSTPDEIQKRYNQIRFTEFVGFTDADGSLRPAKAPEDAKIETATKEQCLDILHDIEAKQNADVKGTVEKHLESQLKAFQKEVNDLSAMYEKASKLDKELIDKLRTLPSKINMVFTVIRQWFMGHDIKSNNHALAFVAASVKTGSPEIKPTAKPEKK